jgi:uncharacterized membrane protein
MSFTRRHATLMLVLWTVELAGVLTLFALAGPERFSAPDHSAHRAAAGAFIMVGYFGSMFLQFRYKRARQHGEVDERDLQVARRASEATLIAASMIIFAVLVILWEVYRDGPGAPAGWFFVLAYGVIALVSLVHAAATLVFDARSLTDG